MIRLLWHHAAIISLRLSREPKLSLVAKWRHDEQVKAHTLQIKLGRLRIIRFRPSLHHARRLGLPAF